ncbi:ABC-type sugar transport system substrate-binding protein [Gracilibacillus halotolerans]|uniref:ABC-type sugar transport system substrate-binding protein n=1 Tax=Gracilibacillus halotolerans TaxID=74386 RepID=A0A841RKL9_9BACI|nr:sugar ABC transporter substrate-binding protein [Gracilibacillus halotolerans]MBB6512417.1 ABC-type sugar transport system substrate-binding protein [Gracilibacillus halotolerans]
MKRFILMFIVVSLAFIFIACGNNSETDGEASENTSEDSGTNTNNTESAEDNGVIGMTVLDLGNPFFVQLTEVVGELAEAEGYTLNVNDPRDDVNSQVDAIQDFISQGVDAIIVTATDQNVINEAIQEAKDAGIPVVAHTTKLENADAWVGADEYSMGLALGQQAGEWILENHSGDGEVGILNFDQIEQVIQRKEGIIDGIHEHAPNVEVVADQQAGDPNSGYNVAEGFIQANPDLVGIFGINDAGALGAYNAAVGAGKDSDAFAVGGIDAVPEAVEAIKEDGIYKFTVDQQPGVTGQTLFEKAFALINGEAVEEETEIEVKAVNSSNIDEY